MNAGEKLTSGDKLIKKESPSKVESSLEKNLEGLGRELTLDEIDTGLNKLKAEYENLDAKLKELNRLKNADYQVKLNYLLKAGVLEDSLSTPDPENLDGIFQLKLSDDLFKLNSKLKKIEGKILVLEEKLYIKNKNDSVKQNPKIKTVPIKKEEIQAKVKIDTKEALIDTDKLNRVNEMRYVYSGENYENINPLSGDQVLLKVMIKELLEAKPNLIPDDIKNIESGEFRKLSDRDAISLLVEYQKLKNIMVDGRFGNQTFNTLLQDAKKSEITVLDRSKDSQVVDELKTIKGYSLRDDGAFYRDKRGGKKSINSTDKARKIISKSVELGSEEADKTQEILNKVDILNINLAEFKDINFGGNFNSLIDNLDLILKYEQGLKNSLVEGGKNLDDILLSRIGYTFDGLNKLYDEKLTELNTNLSEMKLAVKGCFENGNKKSLDVLSILKDGLDISSKKALDYKLGVSRVSQIIKNGFKNDLDLFVKSLPEDDMEFMYGLTQIIDDINIYPAVVSQEFKGKINEKFLKSLKYASQDAYEDIKNKFSK